MQRQGDVLLIPTDSIPQGAQRLATRVVVQGEHSHRLEGGQLLRDPEGRLFVCVEEKVRLLHEEHAPLDLAPGIYRVERQRSYRPDTRPRPVED